MRDTDTVEKELKQGKHQEFENWVELYEWLYVEELESKQEEVEHREELDEIMVKHKMSDDRAKVYLVKLHERVVGLKGDRFAYLDDVE